MGTLVVSDKGNNVNIVGEGGLLEQQQQLSSTLKSNSTDKDVTTTMKKQSENPNSKQKLYTSIDAKKVTISAVLFVIFEVCLAVSAAIWVGQSFSRNPSPGEEEKTKKYQFVLTFNMVISLLVVGAIGHCRWSANHWIFSPLGFECIPFFVEICLAITEPGSKIRSAEDRFTIFAFLICVTNIVSALVFALIYAIPIVTGGRSQYNARYDLSRAFGKLPPIVCDNVLLLIGFLLFFPFTGIAVNDSFYQTGTYADWFDKDVCGVKTIKMENATKRQIFECFTLQIELTKIANLSAASVVQILLAGSCIVFMAIVSRTELMMVEGEGVEDDGPNSPRRLNKSRFRKSFRKSLVSFNNCCHKRFSGGLFLKTLIVANIISIAVVGVILFTVHNRKGKPHFGKAIEEAAVRNWITGNIVRDASVNFETYANSIFGVQIGKVFEEKKRKIKRVDEDSDDDKKKQIRARLLTGSDTGGEEGTATATLTTNGKASDSGTAAAAAAGSAGTAAAPVAGQTAAVVEKPADTNEKTNEKTSKSMLFTMIPGKAWMSIVTAVLFGPVMNVAINVAIMQRAWKKQFGADLDIRECIRTHSIFLTLLAVVGFTCYIACADTFMQLKMNGLKPTNAIGAATKKKKNANNEDADEEAQDGVNKEQKIQALQDKSESSPPAVPVHPSSPKKSQLPKDGSPHSSQKSPDSRKSTPMVSAKKKNKLRSVRVNSRVSGLSTSPRLSPVAPDRSPQGSSGSIPEKTPGVAKNSPTVVNSSAVSEKSTNYTSPTSPRISQKAVGKAGLANSDSDMGSEEDSDSRSDTGTKDGLSKEGSLSSTSRNNDLSSQSHVKKAPFQALSNASAVSGEENKKSSSKSVMSKESKPVEELDARYLEHDDHEFSRYSPDNSPIQGKMNSLPNKPAMIVTGISPRTSQPRSRRSSEPISPRTSQQLQQLQQQNYRGSAGVGGLLGKNRYTANTDTDNTRMSTLRPYLKSKSTMSARDEFRLRLGLPFQRTTMVADRKTGAAELFDFAKVKSNSPPQQPARHDNSQPTRATPSGSARQSPHRQVPPSMLTSEFDFLRGKSSSPEMQYENLQQIGAPASQGHYNASRQMASSAQSSIASKHSFTEQLTLEPGDITIDADAGDEELNPKSPLKSPIKSPSHNKSNPVPSPVRGSSFVMLDNEAVAGAPKNTTENNAIDKNVESTGDLEEDADAPPPATEEEVKKQEALRKLYITWFFGLGILFLIPYAYYVVLFIPPWYVGVLIGGLGLDIVIDCWKSQTDERMSTAAKLQECCEMAESCEHISELLMHCVEGFGEEEEDLKDANTAIAKKKTQNLSKSINHIVVKSYIKNEIIPSIVTKDMVSQLEALKPKTKKVIYLAAVYPWAAVVFAIFHVPVAVTLFVLGVYYLIVNVFLGLSQENLRADLLVLDLMFSYSASRLNDFTEVLMEFYDERMKMNKGLLAGAGQAGTMSTRSNFIIKRGMLSSDSMCDDEDVQEHRKFAAALVNTFFGTTNVAAGKGAKGASPINPAAVARANAGDNPIDLVNMSTTANAITNEFGRVNLGDVGEFENVERLLEKHTGHKRDELEKLAYDIVRSKQVDRYDRKSRRHSRFMFGSATGDVAEV